MSIEMTIAKMFREGVTPRFIALYISKVFGIDIGKAEGLVYTQLEAMK
jgi:hypothetical protein